MSIQRICIREVDTAVPHESVYLAAERMLQRAVGCLVVVDDANRPIGILTDRDLVQRVMAKGLSPTDTFVQDIMTQGLKTIAEDGTIESAPGTDARRTVPPCAGGRSEFGFGWLDHAG